MHRGLFNTFSQIKLLQNMPQHDSNVIILPKLGRSMTKDELKQAIQQLKDDQIRREVLTGSLYQSDDFNALGLVTAFPINTVEEFVKSCLASDTNLRLNEYVLSISMSLVVLPADGEHLERLALVVGSSDGVGRYLLGQFRIPNDPTSGLLPVLYYELDRQDAGQAIPRATLTEAKQLFLQREGANGWFYNGFKHINVRTENFKQQSPNDEKTPLGFSVPLADLWAMLTDERLPEDIGTQMLWVSWGIQRSIDPNVQAPDDIYGVAAIYLKETSDPILELGIGRSAYTGTPTPIIIYKRHQSGSSIA
jgi:hypothetical protein